MATSTSIARGLYSKLIEHLITFPQWDFLPLYHSMQGKKESAYVALTKGKTASSPVKELEAFYHSEEYTEIINKVSFQEEKLEELKRIVKILQKLLAKDKLPPEPKETAELLVQFYTAIERIYTQLSPRRLLLSPRKRTLVELFSLQKKALLEQDYNLFLEYYTQEKEMLVKLQELAEHIHKKTPAYRRLQQEVRRSSHTTILFVLTVLLLFFTFKYHQDRLLPQQFIDLAKDTIQQTEHETAFQEKYGINLFGTYTKDDIRRLDLYLQEYEGAEYFKKIRLTGIHIAAEELAEEAYTHSLKYKAISQLTTHTIRVFSNKFTKEDVDHEIAHFHLNIIQRTTNFNREWKHACGKYSAFNNVIITNETKTYKDGTTGAKCGHVRPYGGKNIEEDVATFAQEIKNLYHLGYSFDSVKEDHSIYKAKIELLKDYEFITEGEYERAKNILAQAY